MYQLSNSKMNLHGKTARLNCLIAFMAGLPLDTDDSVPQKKPLGDG